MRKTVELRFDVETDNYDDVETTEDVIDLVRDMLDAGVRDMLDAGADMPEVVTIMVDGKVVDYAVGS